MFEKLVEQELDDLDAALEEATAKKKKVVRGGKVTKKKSCPAGYKLKGSRCERMKSKERRNRSKGAKRGNRKSKSSRLRSRKRSLRVRKRRGL